MVAVASASFLEGAGTKRIALSQEGLRTLFGHVEAELYQSETYQRALAGLQRTIIGDAGETPQASLRAVAREAIRLAFRQLVRQYQPNVASGQHVSNETTVNCSATTVPKADAAPSEVARPFEATSSSSVMAVATSKGDVKKTEQPSVSGLRHKPTDAPPRLMVSTVNKTTRPDSPVHQKRLALLSQIGSELQRARHEKGISLDQLYNQTWIPVHQIRALEMADVDRLPEDIYVRGFVRRIADALGLDGVSLSSSLSVLESPKAVIPSWHQRSPESPTLRPVHLYLSYAALMAGALGGLAWISQDSVPGDMLEQAPPASSQQSVSHSAAGAETRTTAASQSSGAIASPEVAPPEASPLQK